MKFESTFDFFIFFIVFIKLVFLFSAVGHVVLTHLPKSMSINMGLTDDKLIYWKERTEFIFIASMSILLIYHFRPGHLKPIPPESALLFFLFGWILLITAKWDLFFIDAKWFSYVEELEEVAELVADVF
jgi:hypothetical protein